MPKIFISYRREEADSQGGRLYDHLWPEFGKENIFYDISSIRDGEEFPKIIRKRVGECEVMLVVIGPQWATITDHKTGVLRLHNPNDWVRIEVETGLQRLDREGERRCLVIPVLVRGAFMPEADALPATLRRLTYLNARSVRDSDFHDDVSKLITRLKELSTKQDQTVTPAPLVPARMSAADFLVRYETAFEVGDWDTARTLLAEARAAVGFRYVDLNALEKDLWEHIIESERNAGYDELRALSKGRRTQSMVWDALQGFWETHPGYDPDNLARFKPSSPSKSLGLEAAREAPHMGEAVSKEPTFHPVVPVAISIHKPTVVELLPPPFNWCRITAGKVNLEAGGYVPEGGMQVSIDAFDMAKYPITNAQFQIFVDDKHNGYNNTAWWDFSDGARQWRAANGSRSSSSYGDDCPRTDVCWYEAIAFCRWLRATTNENIMLPTEAQWQYGAQGGDGRIYPWGNDWEGGRRCNSYSESLIVALSSNQRTTPVTRYADGKSPFGVFDMVGNVQEWTLTGYFKNSDYTNNDERRVLRGGKWGADNSIDFRIASRDAGTPYKWYGFRGFRIAKSLT